MPSSVNTPTIMYPESDGAPMAENTKQFRWIVTIEGGIDALFRHDPLVFVAGDLFWYPVEGHPEIRVAPDALVVFGRPKGDRGSYMQWEEEGIAPQVVFEVLSPGNSAAEMARKLIFYDTYGVEEYYLYDPDKGECRGWYRRGTRLVAIPAMHGWVSPRLEVRFEIVHDELQLYRPDGARFVTYLELSEQKEQEHQRAEREHQRAEQERQRADALARRLRELGIDLEAH